MTSAEQKGLDYLFKIRKSKYVKQLIHKHHCLDDWTYVVDGWEAKDDYLQLAAWRKSRRVIIIRRRLPKDTVLALEQTKAGQESFCFLDDAEDIRAFEYAVLVTSLEDEVLSIVRHCRLIFL